LLIIKERRRRRRREGSELGEETEGCCLAPKKHTLSALFCPEEEICFSSVCRFPSILETGRPGVQSSWCGGI
jgi:hypothetical protein